MLKNTIINPVNIERGKRLDNNEWVYGHYWYVDEHADPLLSQRHFIKSINDGTDYEVVADTVGRFIGYAKGVAIYEGDRVKQHYEFFKYYSEYGGDDGGSGCYEGTVTLSTLRGAYLRSVLWYDYEGDPDIAIKVTDRLMSISRCERIGCIHD